MHQTRSKRDEFRRLVILFTVFPLTVISLVAIILMYALGYRLNLATYEVKQGGLMQLQSKPSGATVTLDGVVLSNRTSTRRDISAGTHTVEMRRDGYEPWQKTISINPGSILWLNYARLLPTQLTAEPQLTLSGAASALSVRDSDHLYILPVATRPEITRVALADTTVATTLTLPATLYTEGDGATSRFRLISTDSKGRYLLIQHSYGEMSELLYVDSESIEDSVNLSRMALGDLTGVVFDPTDSRRLYGLVSGHLVQLTPGSSTTVSYPLTGVIAFSVSSAGHISYVSTDSATGARAVGYVSHGTTTPKVLHSYPVVSSQGMEWPESVVLSRYASRDYVAIRLADTVNILSTASLPRSDESGEVLLHDVATAPIDAPETLSVSSSDRFILLESAEGFTTYDLELEHLTTTTKRGDGAASSLAWLDEYSLHAVRGGALYYYEFDGENSRKLLTGVSAVNLAQVSSNNRYLYTLVAKDDGTAELVRLQLLLN